MYNKELYDWMELEYKSLAEGCTLSGQLCPSCKGGNDRLNTLSVSRVTRQLLWFCHRASCDFRRGSKYQGEIPLQSVGPEAKRHVAYPYTYSLPESWYFILQKNYGLSRVSINRADMRFVGEGPPYYYYMPIFNAKDEEVGYQLKAVEKGDWPKNKTQTEYPSAQAWYLNTTKTKSILVVEDQLSAIRSSEYLTSVALLGTHLNDTKLDEILSAEPKFIYLALDADAFTKAVAYVKKYRAKTGGRLQLVRIKKDVKNMDQDEFEEFIGGLQ